MSIKNFLSAVAIFGLLLVSFGSVAQAQGDSYDLFLRIGGQDAIDNGNLDSSIILTGGDYTAQVILRETVGNGTPLLGDSGGLTTVNFLIDPIPTISMVGDEAAPFGPAGEQSSPLQIRGIGIAGPSPKTEVRPGVFESLAGAFTFNFAGPTGQIGLRDGSGGADFGVFTSAGPRNLDSFMTFRTATVTVPITVPEPGSFVVLGLGAVGMVMRRRRR